MSYLGRKGASAALTSADIPDNSITTAKIVDDNVTAAKIPAGAVSSDVLYLENATAAQDLSGTYSTERLYFNDSYQLTGDVTVTGHLALGSIADEDVVITQDSTERTITGSGTIESGELLKSKETDLTGMTGTLGSVVTNNAGVASGSIGSAVTGFTGIKVADTWRIHTDTGYLAADSLLSSNWERVDTDGGGDGTNALVGGSTKMQFSSGIWSFPTEGVWQIEFNINWYAQSGYNPQWLNADIHSTTDGSTYDHISHGTNAGSATQYLNSYAKCFFDVTNITTHKIKLVANPENNSALARGNSGKNETYALFTRLGDT